MDLDLYEQTREREEEDVEELEQFRADLAEQIGM